MKKVCLILLILILTACEASYNLRIEDGNIYEDISVTGIKKEDFMEPFPSFEEFKKTPKYIDKNEAIKYEESYKDDSINLKGSLKSIKDSGVLNKCFLIKSIKENETSIYFRGTGDFSCYYNLDKLKFNLKTKELVLSHNADKVRSDNNYNIYEWDVKKEKPNDIYFQVAKDTKKSKKKDYFNGFTYVHLVIFLLLLALGLLSINLKYRKE